MRFAVRTASFRFCTIQQHQRKLHSALSIPLRNKIIMDHELESYIIKGFYFRWPSAKTWTSQWSMWIDGLKIIERFFTVPLDYSNVNGEKIRVFARHIIPKSKAKTLEDEAKLPFRKPCLVPCSSQTSLIVIYFLCVCKFCTCMVVPDSKSMIHIFQASSERLKLFVHSIIFHIYWHNGRQIHDQGYQVRWFATLSLFYCWCAGSLHADIVAWSKGHGIKHATFTRYPSF